MISRRLPQSKNSIKRFPHHIWRLRRKVFRQLCSSSCPRPAPVMIALITALILLASGTLVSLSPAPLDLSPASFAEDTPSNVGEEGQAAERGSASFQWHNRVLHFMENPDVNSGSVAGSPSGGTSNPDSSSSLGAAGSLKTPPASELVTAAAREESEPPKPSPITATFQRDDSTHAKPSSDPSSSNERTLSSSSNKNLPSQLKPSSSSQQYRHSSVQEAIRTSQNVLRNSSSQQQQQQHGQHHFSSSSSYPVLRGLAPLHNASELAVKRLPQAVIVGAKKSGTRALLEYLRLHPGVVGAGPEPHFFDRNYDKGLDWYR